MLTKSVSSFSRVIAPNSILTNCSTMRQSNAVGKKRSHNQEELISHVRGYWLRSSDATPNGTKIFSGKTCAVRCRLKCIKFYAPRVSLDLLIYHAKFNAKFGITLGKIHPGSADPGERMTPNSGLPNQACLASVHAGKAKVVLAVETTEEEPVVCHHTEGFRVIGGGLF